MTLTIFPFEKLPNMLTMLQFTFRLFEFTSFFFAIVAAINYGLLIKNFNLKDILVLSTIIILPLIPYKDKLDFDTKYDENNLINPVPLTSQTGRVHAGMASMEYMPSKMFNNLNYVINRKDEPIILKENGKEIAQYNLPTQEYLQTQENLQIQEYSQTQEDLQIQIVSYSKNGTNMNMELKNVQENTTIELPYTYYLGYRIYVNGEEIKYTESDNGFIQIKLDKNDNAVVEVKYLGTNEMLTAFAISVISLVLLIIIEIKKWKNKKI